MNEFLQQLQHRLALPLPGEQAQLLMSPPGRRRALAEIPSLSDYRSGAVLILLYPDYKEWHTVLMLRPEYDGTHGGQVSFPGGKLEESDQSLADTALRETHEEIGVPPASVKILGALTELYIPPSKFLVSPYIGVAPQKPAFVADPVEVDRVIEVSLRTLLIEAKPIEREIFIQRRNMRLVSPAYEVSGEIIWGATAMIISELRELTKGLIQ